MTQPDHLAEAAAAKVAADQALLDQILTDLRARRPVGEIAAIIGRSREHVRRLAREHDIPTKGGPAITSPKTRPVAGVASALTDCPTCGTALDPGGVCFVCG